MSKISNSFGLAGVLLYIALILAAVIGWVMNIIQIVHMSDGGVTAKLIIKLIGVFAAPLGALMGWIG